MKEKLNKETIDEMLKNSVEEIVDENSDFTDEFGNIHNVEDVINKAELYAKKKYPKVNFRWSEIEIARAKRIALKLGLPYQTYIKSLLKQGMDLDEKRLREM